MKSFLIIGIGNFGRHLCEELNKMRCEVTIADLHEEAMEGLLGSAAAAKVCDCTNPEVLRSFDVPSFDAVFVCVEGYFQACLEITDQLKELGARRIYSKADRDLDAKFLLRNGADYVIYPERDAAERIAISESSDQIFDFIELSRDCAICEISPRPEWEGRTLGELAFRSKYGLSLIAARRSGRVLPVTDPDYAFASGEHIYVMGAIGDIRRIT